MRLAKRLFRFSSRTRDDVRRDVAEEFAFHLEMRAADLVRSGLSEAEARTRALKEFGDPAPAARAIVRGDERLEHRRRLARLAGEFWQDGGMGLRLLVRNPAFAAAAILTLALGVGGTTSIYSVLDAVLLRPLPYPEPDRIMLVSETLENGNRNNTSGGAFLDWRERQTGFEALALTGRVSGNLRGSGTPERLRGLEVSHEFLRVLGISPMLGRGFLPDEDRPGGRNDVVLISESLWRSRFGADPSIVGRVIVLDEVQRTVIGVLPAGAWVFEEEVFFVPALLRPGTPRAQRMPHWAVVFGRLAPDVTAAQADAGLKAIKRQLTSEYPSFKKDWSVEVRPVTEVIGGVTRAPLLILLGAALLVLLIACTNVANLLLARACHRQQELAVRVALGAGSARLVRQVLTENFALALLGGAAGVTAAYLGVDVLRELTADVMPPMFAPQLDVRVLAFALAATFATGLLSGLLPALRARRPDLNAGLNNGGRSATAGGRQRTQAALVVAEVALTVVLLASAGLLLRSLARAASVDPGFDPGRVLAFDISLPQTSYGTPARRFAFASELLDRLRALPGVDGAGTGMAIPFSGGGYGEYFRRPGRPKEEEVIGRVDFVSAGYLEALGARLVAGRRLTPADNRPTGARVAVISATTARRFFPATSPIGEPLLIAGNTWQVVGVVEDIADRRLDAPASAFAYLPQAFDTSMASVVLRTRLDPLSLVPSVRRELERMDPGVAVANPRALDRAMAGSMAQRKAVLSLVSAFAVSALALAAIGLYGVMAYAVATRRREFGIRMALGAVRADVVREVLGGGLRLTGLGLLLGLAGAAASSRVLAGELFQVRSSDPAVLGGTMALLLAVSFAACVIPAWRASQFESIEVLRRE